MVSDSLFNFSVMLFNYHVPELIEGEGVHVDQVTAEKYVLQHEFGIPTPV